jgi:hypothetical protein
VTLVPASWDVGCKPPVLIVSVSASRAAAAPLAGDDSWPQRFCRYASASLLQLRWSHQRLYLAATLQRRGPLPLRGRLTAVDRWAGVRSGPEQGSAAAEELHPPFSFVLAKENVPCTVQKKTVDTSRENARLP